MLLDILLTLIIIKIIKVIFKGIFDRLRTVTISYKNYKLIILIIKKK